MIHLVRGECRECGASLSCPYCALRAGAPDADALLHHLAVVAVEYADAASLREGAPNPDALLHKLAVAAIEYASAARSP